MKHRIVKQHDVRRQEFLVTARRLFESQGYEQTSVDQIVQRLKLAKGAFYHYFDSKEDLLQDILQDQLDQMLSRLEILMSGAKGNAVTKLNIFTRLVTEWKIENRALMRDLIRAVHRSASVSLHQKLFAIGSAQLGKVLTEILRQGAREHTFNINDPASTADVLLTFWTGIRQTIAQELHATSHRTASAADVIKKIRAAEQATDRILGMKGSAVRLFDTKRLHGFLHGRTTKSCVS